MVTRLVRHGDGEARGANPSMSREPAVQYDDLHTA